MVEKLDARRSPRMRPPDAEWHYELGPLEGLLTVEELREVLTKKYPFLHHINEFMEWSRKGETTQDDIDKSQAASATLTDEEREIEQEYAMLCWQRHRTIVNDEGYLERQVD